MYSNRLRRQLILFLVIGGTSVFIDYVAYRALLSLTVQAMPAKGVSYCVGMIVGYLGNKVLTFQVKDSKYTRVIMYLLLYAATLALNVVTNLAVLQIADSPTIAFLVATGVTTVANFLGMKFFAFRNANTAQVDLRASNLSSSQPLSESMQRAA